jgi:hypothetical protein
VTMVKRLLVVGWMVGGLFAAAVAVGVPLTIGYAAAVRGAVPGADARWLQVGMLWAARGALCAAIWFLSKRAARVAGPQGPSGPPIFLSALGGGAVGLLVGLAAEGLCDHGLASATGSQSKSLWDDIVTAGALLGYARAAFAATFVSKGRTAAA